jgi:hypothetical protein
MLGKQAGEGAMGADFDPYHKWLGIPPEEQPADHYRLLGIKASEDDPDVIEGAADQRMMVLRTHQTGPHGELSQQLLNEVAAAKVCLLNPEKRAAYDRKLQQRLAVKTLPRAVPLAAGPVGPVPPGIVRPPRRSASRGPRTALVATGVAAAAALIVVLAVWGNGSPPEDTAATTPAEPTDGPPVPPPPPGKEQPEPLPEDHVPDVSPPSAEPAEPTPEPDPPEIDPSPEAPAGQPAVEPVTAPGRSADAREETPAEVPDEPPAEPVPARPPVPAAAEQAAVHEQLAEIYDLDKDRPDAEKLKLAKEFQALGGKETSTAAERFVLWRKASELARDAGDGVLMFQIIDAMGERYEIDLLMVKGAMLKTLAQRASDTARIRSVISASHQYADDAVRHDRYDLALAAAKLAHEACVGPQGREFRKAAYDRVRQLEAQHEKQQELEAALAAVQANPHDSEANLYLGRLYCFEQSDWRRGLPHLARSANPELANLAAEDLKAPEDAPGRLQLADAWWDLAQAREGEEKNALLLRAGQWYKAALPDVSSALEKVKVEKRLGEISRSRRTAHKGRPTPATRVGGALKFDGKSSYLQSSLRYTGSSPITIEAVATPSSTKGIRCLLGNLQHSGVGLETVKGRWAFTFHDRDAYKHAYSNQPIELGKRVVLAGVADGRTVKLFVNGELQSTARVLGHKPSPFPLMVGADPNGRGRPEKFFAGEIECVRISAGALYDGSYEPADTFRPLSSTVLLLRFDEGKGEVAYDSSSHANDCRIVGAEWGTINAARE